MIDTHAHLTDEAYEKDREEVIARAKKASVDFIIEVGLNEETLQKSIALAEKNDFIYTAVGFHPYYSSEVTTTTVDLLLRYAKHKKVVAIGEIGLDYFKNEVSPLVQQEAFLKQLYVAKKANLPIIIHNRNSFEDVLAILKSKECKGIKGVLHCFSETMGAFLDEILKLPFLLGFGGVVTFKNASKLKDIVKYLPLEKIVLETDCPYLSPVPFRGKRNEPSYLSFIAKEISSLKGISVGSLLEATDKNSKKLFSLP